MAAAPNAALQRTVLASLGPPLNTALEGEIVSAGDLTSTKGLFRVVLWGGVWTGFGVLSLLNELQRGQPHSWVLAVLSVLWVAVCFRQILDLAKLKAGSSNERLMTVVSLGVSVLTALGIVGAAYLYTAAYTMHLLGLYVIPSSAVLGALLALLAWRAEPKAKVRVFVGNRGWVYVGSPSNRTPPADARDTPAPASDIGARAR